MKSKKVIFLVLLLSMLAIGCFEENEIQEVQETTQVEMAAADETPVADEPEQPPQKGSYENPADIGETVTIKSMGSTFDVSVEEVNRGEDALFTVLEGNMYNEEPPEGYEYMLVNMNVKYVAGDGSTSLSQFDFKAFAEGVECENPFVVLPNRIKEFSSGDVMPGATKTGWIAFVVPTGQDVLISFNPNMFSDTAAYINIGQ